VTDSSDPARPSSRPSREPPTLDLTATVVDEGARQESSSQENTNQETTSQETTSAEEGTTPSEAERAEAAQDAMLEGGPSDDPSAPEAPGPEPLGTPESASRGPALGALAGAGLLGGLIGAGAILAFQAWRPVPLPSDPRVAELEQRIAALPRPDNAALERRLSALEGAQTGFTQRLQAVAAQAERSAARAEEAFNRQPPAPAAPPANDAALGELGNRIGAVEAQLREQGQAAAGERQAIRQSVEGAAGAAQGLERRLAEQEQRIAALTRAVEERGGEAARAGTRLVLANRLDAALREGAPYRDVIEGLRHTGADPAKLSALEPFAQSGAPTAAALAQSFKPVAARISEATRPAPAPATPAPAAAGSWTDRLLGLARQVVTIREVDAPSGRQTPGAAGQPTGAATTALEQALARGDLGAASAAWDALPEAARQASAEWGQQLKQRAAAEAASRALATDAVAALNSSTR
jgi:hypothetical protein